MAGRSRTRSTTARCGRRFWRRPAEADGISLATVRLRTAGVALSLIGAAITAYLTVEHGRGVAPACGIGHGCEVVAASSYAHVGSVPTAAFGLLLYLLLALSQGMLLADPPSRVRRAVQAWAVALSLVGAGFSGWLTYVEVAVLHAVCLWCSVSAAILGLLLLVTAADLVRGKRAFIPASQAFAENGGLER